MNITNKTLDSTSLDKKKQQKTLTTVKELIRLR